MDIQNYLLCILYIILIISHSFTLAHKDFHRKLISVFSIALLTQTTSTVLVTLQQQELKDFVTTDLNVHQYIEYVRKLTHIISINFFILFLLIIAKGWPITRRDMPYKYSFAIFWLLCFLADLITFHWSSSSATNETHNNHNNHKNASASVTTTIGSANHNDIIISQLSSSIANGTSETQSNDSSEHFDSMPRRLSLVIRIVIMLYFLLELRTTMILEQEQKKLQFYLHFGALSMVWFVHSLIVYLISLRVESDWQEKLIPGFSSAADFLAFVVTARLLWPKSTNSFLFRKYKSVKTGATPEASGDNMSAIDSNSEDGEDEEGYDGLEMRDLSVVK